MSKWDDFLTAVRDGAAQLAKGALKDYAGQVSSDANAFAKRSKTDLIRWTKMLAKHEISKTEFSDLVHGLKSLAAMDALKQAGLAIITVQRLRDQIIDLVIDKAFAILL
jgi:hypothetical protein